MILIEASWPSNRLAAVTNRSLARVRGAAGQGFNAQIGHRVACWVWAGMALTVTDSP